MSFGVARLSVRARHKVQDHGARCTQQSHAARNSVLALLPAVRNTLTRICCVRAPSQVRFPAPHLAAITMPRIARSAVLLVASSRTVQEREQPQQFMVRDDAPADGWLVPAARFQHPVQFGFQLSRGDAQPRAETSLRS